MAVPYVPVDMNPTTSAATTGNDTMQSAQYAVVYDLISEGEIQGLVDGAASIYLNGTPLTSQSTKSTITPIAVSNGVFTASSTTVTHAAGGLANTVGRYAILERGANTNSTFAGNSGSPRLTTTSAYFANTMAVNNQQFPILNPKIRVDGLGPGGREYIGTITQVVSNTVAIVEPPISTTGSGKTGARDHVSYVTTASATSITIAAAPTLSGKRFQLVPLTSSATSYTSDDSWNFKNVTMNFRAGTREQTPIIYPNIPTASFLSSIEAPFLWTTGWGGTASVLNYNSAFLGLSSPGEVDKLKIGIEFPGGLYKHNGEQQQIRDSFLGLQVIFQYTQGGITKNAYILGPTSSAGVPAGVQRHADWLNYLERFTGLVQARIQTPFVHDIEFSVEQFKPFTDFTILISRTSPDDNTEVQSNDDSHVFAAKIKYIESQIVDKFRYPHSAYAAISFPAEGFSSIPTRSYKARGLKISVPSNYIPREENVDGIARYIGRWDGTFITKYTNNPAWIFYDLATNKRYGLGKYVDSSLIDKFGLYRIARYCDELVSNGKGALEPRFTCNVYITQAEEAYKLLRDLATTFRGMTYWAQGALMVTQDRPKEPIYTFTQGNVVDGIFNYEYSGRNARFNEVNITWTNPDQFYAQDVLTVTDQTDIIKRGRIVSMDTVAFGCTSESQAYRVALWNMITSQLETEFVSFTSGINASTLLPGDVINIQDHHLNAIQTSGRIKSAANTTNITLDRNVTLVSGSTYVLHVVYDGPGCYLQQSSANVGGVIYYRGDLIPGVANSTAAAQLLDTANSPVAVSFSPEVHVQRKTINNSLPYTGNVISVSSAFSSTPNTESVWAVENITLDNGVAPKKYRVLSIREEPDALYTIVASNYAEEKFEELEARVKIAPPAYTGPRPGEDVPPVTVMIPQYVRSTVDDLGQEVDAAYFALISWSPPNQTYTDSTGTSRTRSYPYVSTYEVRYDFFDVPSTTIKEYVTETVTGTRNSLEVYGVTPGNYQISIRVKNTIGEYSPWYTQNITFERQGSLPGNLIKGLKPGGAVDSGVIFNSNTFTIIDSYYTYTNPAGTTYTIQPATSAQSAQSFANLRSNSTFYLLWDASNTADPLKAVEYYSDPNVLGPYGAANSYWVEAGSANNGLLTLPGTVTVTQFTNKVTGTGTFFSSNLSIGNLVKLHDSSNNANAFYAVVASITSNTELYTREIIQKPYTAKQLQTLSFKTNYKDDALLAQITTGAGNTANLTIQYVTSTVNEPQLLVLDTTSSGFRYDGNNALIGPTSITFAVNRQNLLGPTNWYVFDANNNSLSNSVLETRTNTSAIINSTSFGNISNNNFIRVRTDVDTLTSNATIFKIRDGLIGANGAPGANGANGTSGVSAATLTLSKASVTLFAYADGNVDGYADAAGQASLYLGNTNVTESTTWASSATVGLTGTISNTSGSKGQYSVSNLATANNTGALTITATYSGLTYTGVFSVSKAKGGYEIASTLPSTNLFQGRVVFLTTDNKLYRYTGTAWTTVVNEADIANAAISTAKFAAGIEPVTIANSAAPIPTTRSTEYINWSSRLYRWNGSAYVAAVSNTELTGTIISSQIANASISIAKFASGIEPVTIANSALALPTTRSTEYINWSSRLYRWNGSAYVAAVSNTELTGTIINSQIADSAISELKLANNAVAAAKIQTGAITASKLNVGIGGGNLVQNSNFKSTNSGNTLPNGWAVYNNGAINTTTNVRSGGLFNTNLYQITADQNTTQQLGIFTRTDLSSGGVTGGVTTWTPDIFYTISFWARANNAIMVGKTMQGLYSNMGFNSVDTLYNPPLVENTWQRYVWRVKPNNNVQTPFGELFISWDVGGTLLATSSFEICAPQVEQGEIATAYAPRPDEILPGTIGTTQIANDAITSDKIIANAITSNKIAVNSLEGDRIKANTLDAAKIVANSITSDQLAANSVVAVKIQAGAITSEKITSGAITTNKLYVVPMGSNLVPDSFFTDATAWNDAYTGVLVTGITDANVGSTAIRNADNLYNEIRPTNFIEVNRDKKYRYEVWAKQLAGSGTAVGYLGLIWYDSSKNVLPSNQAQPAGAGNPSGWNNGSYSYFGISGVAFPANWTRYSIQFGAGEAAAIPSNARYMRPVFLLNYNSIAGAQHAVTGVRIEEKTDAELIVDGSITTNKITVNSLNGDRISANTLDAAKIVANSITANQIAAAAISADEIAAGAVTTSKLTVGDFSVLNKNWNFEEGDVVWGRETGWTISNEAGNAKSGSWVANSTATVPAAIRGSRVPTSQNEVFYAEAYIKHAAGTTGTGSYVRITGFNSAGAEIWQPGGTLVGSTTTSYTISTLTGTVPANVVEVGVEIVSNITAGKTYLDEVRMFRVSNSTLIADGAITTNKITVNSLNGDRISAGTLDAAKIVANSITANQIAAAAISAEEIAAGAIRTDKLLVAGQGSAINDDPQCKDSSAWTGWSGNPVATVTAITDGKSGNSVLRASTSSRSINARLIPISDNKVYRVSAWVRQQGNGTLYLRTVDYPANETNVQNGIERLLGLEAISPPSATWTYYSATYTPPAGRAFATPHILLAWLGSSGYMEAQDIRLEEILPGTLIANGAITTAKLTANAVTANEISAGAVTAAKMDVTFLSAISGNVGTLNAGTINLSNMNITGTSTTALNIKSAASGERMEIGSSVIKIFDSSGTLRVKIGNLSL